MGTVPVVLISFDLFPMQAIKDEHMMGRRVRRECIRRDGSTHRTRPIPHTRA
jgi:hypothetical protein